MSEGDVNLIRDEDVLRRMWQQTEDFGRKKEIRAHMYRLREERLRNLYSPEPTPAKGCEFSSGQAHVNSFADQTFQSMKSKEVRDAGSPPKEFNYRGQDLKDLSNAGWNVESEDRTTDDGRTHVKSVNANIEGRYDVEGGRGQFSAVDRQRKAVTEHQDDNTKMRRDESSSNSAAHEHVVRQTDDGTKFSSTTSSSNTSSKFKQESSTVHVAPAIHDYDQAIHDTNRNEKVTKITHTEQNLRSNDFQNGELVSRKIDYPDDNTKVIVETRCLPDGTRVTSTRREFRAPAQSTRSEYQTKSESKSFSSQQKSDTKESFSKTIRHTTDSSFDDSVRGSKTNRYTTDSSTDDIVDSQRHVDDHDFKRQLREYTVDDDTNLETHRTNRRQDTKISKDHLKTENDYSQTRYQTRVNNKVIDRSTNVRDDCTQVQHSTNQRYTDNVDQTDRREVIETYDDRNVSHRDVKKTHHVVDTNERFSNISNEPTLRDTKEPARTSRGLDDPVCKVPGFPEEPVPKVSSEQSHRVPNDERVYDISNVTDKRTQKITRDTNVEEKIEKKTSSDHYQTTYKTDYQQKKVSNDWSPTHQAWASTLRADTPSTTRPSTRASSPGSRTFKSSTSSLRSSVSPDKNFRKPSSRGGSPSKVDRDSPTRSVISDRYSSTHSSHSVTEERTNKHSSPPTGRTPAGYSPERKPQDSHRQRPSVSPEKRSPIFTRPSMSPERKPSYKTPSDGFPRNASSPTRAAGLPSVPRQSPERLSRQPSDSKTIPDTSDTSPHRSSTSLQKKPTTDSPIPAFPRASLSPDRNRFEKPKRSPERDVGYKQPTPSREAQDITERPSVSPNRTPGYMKPTAASQPTPKDEPSTNSPSEPSQTPDRKHSRTVTQVKEDHYKLIDEETKMNTRTDKTHSAPKDKKPSPTRGSPSKESPDFIKSSIPKGRSPSPQKKTVIITENDELYGRINKTVELADVTTTHGKPTNVTNSVKRTSIDTSEDKCIPAREDSSTQYGTYDKKKPHNVTNTTKVTTVTSSNDVKYDSLNRDKTSPKKNLETPSKKNPRHSSSPVKSPSRETKYTTDFISTEINTEEVNKKKFTKDHPRQLQTPSSSPTRKPKDEPEPSTGQSSPTTSVSGFVYFGSPRPEKQIVTDLDDDFEPGTTYPDEPNYARPESLDLTRSTSPSKIPCRSPSPEKRESPIKENLPRKSSLKKPSGFVNQTSPMEKPPSSFRVSPTEDNPEITCHQIVKKDHPGEPETSLPMKSKPPLTRRETYEDRCKLILGMVDKATNEKVSKETKKTKKPESDKSSPSVSPCDSPIPQELFSDFPTQEEIINSKTDDIITLIANEQKDLTKTTISTKPKTPSRECSPTQLQDIIPKTTTRTQIDNTTQKEKDACTETKNQIKRHSPEKVKKPSTDADPISKITQNETSDYYTKGSSPTKPSRLSVSPDRKQSIPVIDSPDKQPRNNQPKQTSPTRTVKTSSYNKTKMAQSSEFDTTSATENINVEYTNTTKSTKEKSPRTRVLESPTRQSASPTLDYPSAESQRPVCGSPLKEEQSPLHKDQYPKKESPSKPTCFDKTPGYMKTTTAVSSKYDTTLSAEDIEETFVSTVDKKHKTTKISTSPTLKNSQDVPRSVSPTKSSVSSIRVPKNERSPERKPTKEPVKITESKDSSPHDLPGYMRTTASITSKDNIITKNVNESTRRTVERKHPSSRPSPTRIVSAPRTPSPTKVTDEPKKPDASPDTIFASKQLSSTPMKNDDAKKPKVTPPKVRSPTRSSNEIPSYMKTTSSVSSKYDSNDYNIITKDTQETISLETKENYYPNSRESPSRILPKSNDKSSPDYLRAESPPIQSEGSSKRNNISPECKPEDYSPTSKITKFKNTTTTLKSQSDTASTSENVETFKTSTVQKRLPSEPINRSPERKPGHHTPVNDSSPKWLHDKPIDKSTPKRPSVSPDKKPSYMKPTASVISKHEISQTMITKDDIQETNTLDNTERKSFSPRTSPTRQFSQKTQKDNLLPKAEELKQLRTPSPTKKAVKVTEVSTDFLMSEREQEILDRVHKSLRKLSPERKEKSPSREKSPNKTTTSLSDLDITTESVETHEIETQHLSDVLEEHAIIKTDVTNLRKLKDDKTKNQNITSKPSSRNVSPIKRAPSVPTSSQAEKSPESPIKSRSISPRKPLSQSDRPQSPHGVRASGIRPRDQVPFNRKPTPVTLSTYKIEKLTVDVKKTNGVTKQNVSKTITSKGTSRLVSPQSTKPSEPETKRIPTSKGIKESISSRKETVTRTSSDSNIKPKKISPQRVKSKPEIQVNDLSTKSPKYQKPIINEPHSKLPAKPKSATALNTSTDDDDDIIIDVQQSKSSRENSPDRICPTPVNLADDVSTPRFPDEVSEPDDEYRRRSYHTIHETESVVDDIVEICEDEELFVKKPDVTSTYDESLLSVNDKVTRFSTKTATKPRDTTTTFKDTEKKVHSDFTDENIKSDECLLSVSEKVNKFAKGPSDIKDNRSPSRKITDEYDKHTIYQDDYTKLSVNDKAHLFVETAENIKVPKVKLAHKVDRPDLSNVDESLKKDDCLLSVSDKVNKFVKTAENFLTEAHEVDQKERKIKEQHDKIMKHIVDDDDETYELNKYTTTTKAEKNVDESDNLKPLIGKDGSPKLKPSERTPTTKITTLRSSDAVKKAKALFENIASTQKNKDVIQTTVKATKLTDIGVVKKSPKTDSTIVLHPSVEDMSPNVTDAESELDATSNTHYITERPTSGTLTRPGHSHAVDKLRASPNRLTAQSPEVPRAKSPKRQSVEISATKTVFSKYPGSPRAESPRTRPESPRHRPESEKSDKVPGYLRPTKTSQIKEETKIVEESEVSTRRGSGKFGVELRRTSIERSTVSSERRRSVEHHQPCIEDIFDLDLLEQMLEKVVGYEQRRRIRSQIRVVKNDTEDVDTSTHTRTKHTTSTPKLRTLRQHSASSPERVPKSTPQRTLSPNRQSKTPQRTHPERSHPKESSGLVMNGHAKEPVKTIPISRLRPHSPEKPALTIRSAKSPTRQPSPVKKRTVSPTKTTTKPKSNRFNEYASAYMKKVGLNEGDKVKFADKKTKKGTDTRKTVSHETQDRTSQEFTTTKSFTATSERTSSRDVIEIVQVNGKRSPSPEKMADIPRKPQSPERRVYSPVGKALSPERRDHSTVNKAPERQTQTPECKAYSPERKAHSPEGKVYSPATKTYVTERKVHSPERRVYSPVSKTPERKPQSPARRVASPAEHLYQRSPSPEFKRQKSDAKKETIIKNAINIDKKVPSKPVQEEKPSWVMNRNLKKITSETRTFSSKKLETEKSKYRATSPSKVISKPIDVITSSYGPGPLDADGRPLFGIKALRNGATNIQVKGTVIRQEFHSRNGGEPEGTVSVTAYSSQPEELEELMTSQGVEPPSRIHGISAITTTKKFGGDTGISMSRVNTKEERASLEHFTHTDRKMESQVDNMQTCNFDSEDTTRQINSRKSDRTDRSDKRREERVTEVRKGQREERTEKVERKEDKKTVRQNSVKSLTEKFIKSANDSGKTDRSTYPKAGLILRTTSTIRDSFSSDEAHPGLTRADSEHSIGSVDDLVVTTTTDRTGAVTTTTRTSRHHGPTTTHQRTSTVTHHEPIITTKKTTTVITDSQEPVVTRVVTQGPVVTKTVTGQRHGATVTERSFLDSNTKVTGVQDILTRMKNADIVIEDGDTTEDSEARALLNKFLGATVLMAGMQSYVSEPPAGKLTLNQETVRSGHSGGKASSTRVEDIDLDQCWDERLLRQLLDECTDYEQRRRLRARIRSLMAEQEACAAAVTDALGAAHITSEPDGAGSGGGADARGESLLLPLLQGLLGGGGERLLAGLGAAPADVVADVRRSLGRLRAALAEPAAHPQARALLALADRLEDALDAADRLDGCRRKPRRRSRAARHTVGVTREELEQARRRVDADPLGLSVPDHPASTSAGSTGTSDGAPTPERKASVDVDGELDFHAPVEAKPKPPPPQHSVSYEPPRVSHDAQAMPAVPPVERRVHAPRRPDFFRHSVADATPQQPIPRMDRRPSETKSSIAAIANKFDATAQMERQQTAAAPRRAPVVAPKAPVKDEQTRTFFRPLPPTYNFAAPPPPEDESKPFNRFNGNKKLRMKRANTIDIGRPLAGYRLDSDTDDDNPRAPIVPDFRPQTDNDRKFVAFMKKNEAAERESAVNGGGPANWSRRFGNIKNAFESRDRDDHSRSSSSSSSARRFWHAAEDPASGATSGVPRGRRLFAESTQEIIKPPWVTERREPARIPPPHLPRQAQLPRAPPVPPPAQIPVQMRDPLPFQAPAPSLPKRTPAPTSAPALPLQKLVSATGPPLPQLIAIPPAPPAPAAPQAPASLNPPPVPQSPTRPEAKPFAARPIPVNQFSHAPMSAFKPPAKVASPVSAPAHVWSPPSFGVVSPSGERALPFPTSPRSFGASPQLASWAPVPEPVWTVSPIAAKLENAPGNGYPPVSTGPFASDPPPPHPTTYAPMRVPPQTENHPMKAIPSQNELSAPELVRRMNGDPPMSPPEVDAQRLQIEFYERQIREKRRREALEPPPPRKEPGLKPPPPPGYTITDFTPHGGVSTFMPLQRTPDIEKARAHKVDYLPDVVTNETDRPRTPLAAPAPRSPRPLDLPVAVRNGDALHHHHQQPQQHQQHTQQQQQQPPQTAEQAATEHAMAVARVMRGPVRGAATVTAGVRTRGDAAPAEALRGALGLPERRRRTQVPPPAAPAPAPAPHARPSPPSLGASRESIASSESFASAGLSRSGSWHQLSAGDKSASTSPRRVVSRAKSLHLLAVPKLFEGGIAREEVTEKRRSVEAYFAGGPAPVLRGARGGGRPQRVALGRSRTMAAVSELQFLDESNADDAFEDLVSALA